MEHIQFTEMLISQHFLVISVECAELSTVLKINRQYTTTSGISSVYTASLSFPKIVAQKTITQLISVEHLLQHIGTHNTRH